MLTLSLLAVRTIDVAQNSPSESEDCGRYLSKPVPKFNVAKRYRSPIDGSLVLFGSVSPAQSDREDLVALACNLGRVHSAENQLFVWILNDFQAAKRFNPSGEGNDRKV